MSDNAIIFIPLTQGKVAVIDFEDRWVLQFGTWFSHRNRNGAKWYARNSNNQYMHRLIFNSSLVDHKDRDGLNNTRENLRNATASQNNANSHKRGIYPTSRFKGVYWCNLKWRSRIRINSNRIHLGYFDNELSAAIAYDVAAISLFGEFACTNEMLGLLDSQPAQPAQSQ